MRIERTRYPYTQCQSQYSEKEHPVTREVKVLYYNTFYTLFLLTWTTVLWVTLLYKLTGDGWVFFTYFTNWNWTLQTLFFTMELLSYLTMAKYVRIFTISFVFWLINGTTWLVFWLVMFMIKDNANFFLEMSTIDGGKYPFAVVLEGHALFHVLISVSVLVFVILQKKHVDDSVSLFVDWEQNWKEVSEELPPQPELMGHPEHLFLNWTVGSIFFILYVLLAPLIILGIYIAAFDIRTVYGITTPLWQLILSAIAIVIVFNGAYVSGLMIDIVVPKTELYRFYGRYFRCC